jgi:hypothetical protein
MDASIKTGEISDESKGITKGELIRDYTPVEGVQWRFGKPNYARVNQSYFTYRSKKHPEGSLEAVVSKVVKNWEVESHHIADIAQWNTMDVSKFAGSVNGGQAANAQALADVGPYNFLLGKCPGYDGTKQTFESANTIFSEAFTEGFAWEVLEVFSGPPSVAFKWRHFGMFSGQYVDDKGAVHKGDNKLMELFGLCIAKVNASLVIEELQVFYEPKDMIAPLMKKPAAAGGFCSFCRRAGADEEKMMDEVQQQV